MTDSACRLLHTLHAAVYAVRVKPPRRTSKTDPVLDRLEREGRLRPATVDLRDVLARRGPARSPTPAPARRKSSAATVAESAGSVLYADTSALVKLVVREAESDAIEADAARWDLIATGDIAAIELSRATPLSQAKVFLTDHRF